MKNFARIASIAVFIIVALSLQQGALIAQGASILIIGDKLELLIPSDSLLVLSALRSKGYSRVYSSTDSIALSKACTSPYDSSLVELQLRSNSVISAKQTVFSSTPKSFAGMKQHIFAIIDLYGGTYDSPGLNDTIHYTWNIEETDAGRVKYTVDIIRAHSSESGTIEIIQNVVLAPDSGIQSRPSNNYMTKLKSSRVANSYDIGLSFSMINHNSSVAIGSIGGTLRYSYLWADYYTFIVPSTGVFNGSDVTMSGIAIGACVDVSHHLVFDLGAAYTYGNFKLHSTLSNSTYESSGADWQPLVGFRLFFGGPFCLGFHYDKDRGATVDLLIRGV